MNARLVANPFLEWFQRYLLNKKPTPVFGECHLAIIGDGFRLSKDTQLLESVTWQDVQIIVAYKRDLITTDLICFQIVLDNGDVIEVNEEMDGFDGFLGALERQYPSFNRSWPDSVVHPPFAPNHTVVYTAIPG